MRPPRARADSIKRGAFDDEHMSRSDQPAECVFVSEGAPHQTIRAPVKRAPLLLCQLLLPQLERLRRGGKLHVDSERTVDVGLLRTQLVDDTRLVREGQRVLAAARRAIGAAARRDDDRLIEQRCQSRPAAPARVAQRRVDPSWAALTELSKFGNLREAEGDFPEIAAFEKVSPPGIAVTRDVFRVVT